MLPEGEHSKSKVHFTYSDNPDMESLCQGDVLNITESLRKTLKEVHPYFLNKQYRYFMVLTQSCDLVRRERNPCKTPYITLAAIRSFDDFFEKTLTSLKYIEKENGLLILNAKNKDKTYQLIERLYNNTERDYFFLYKDELLDFPESMVASLKVSIALKSHLHYDECLEAKKLELSDEFKAKLGWLVGNIYSRVGTKDWEGQMTNRERREMLNGEITSRCVIGASEQIAKLKAALREQEQAFDSVDQAVEFVSGIKVETRFDKVMKEIEKVVMSPEVEIQPEIKERLLKRIKNKQQIKSLLQT